MAKGFLDTELIPDRDYDFISLKIQKKMFGKQYRRCRFCGSPATFHPFATPVKLQVFISFDGVVGVQEVRCPRCDSIESITSSDKLEVSQIDRSLQLSEAEVEYYSPRLEHQDIVHDMLELLHLAAIYDPRKRRARHAEVASLVLEKAKIICEEWCKPEYSDLRYRKFLVMFKETVLNCSRKPQFTSDVSEEYKEMYKMLNNSFLTNKTNVELLLCLLKETLFDKPSVAAFMMWVKVSMLHADRLTEFESLYKNCQELKQQYYVDLMDRFVSVDIPVGLKKIPVVFVLFELPRFYHYAEFCNRRCRRPIEERYVLPEVDRKALRDIEARMQFLKEQDSDDEDCGSLFDSKDMFKQALDAHLKRADQIHGAAPDGIHLSEMPAEIQALDKINGIDAPRDEKRYLKTLMNTFDLDPVQLRKQTMSDTQMQLEDYEVSIQSTVMTHFVKPKGSPDDCTQDEIDNAKHLNKFIDATKITEIDNETGNVKVYERIAFKYTDDNGKQRETVLMQSVPKKSKIIGYDRKTFKLADLGNYEIVPIERKAITAVAPALPMIDGVVGKDTRIPRTVDELPPDVREILLPLLEDEPGQPLREYSVEEVLTETSSKIAEKLLPLTETQSQVDKLKAAEKSQPIVEELEEEEPKEESPEKNVSEGVKSHPGGLDNATATPSAPPVVPLVSENQVVVPRKPRSKRPNFKYGTKWRKNKMTYDVNEVADSDSDKEEEYTFYPCKLLSEYVESQNIVETAPKDLSPGLISLPEFLESRDIHQSLWTIKKKYIHNELFVILDVAHESERAKLPLVSASNNRGVSVPVLPILNPSTDSSALDMTIGSLYGVQVSHKLSNKQRNVFQRYVRIAVARARHPLLFGSVSLGAIKYVKTNDKCVEVKLSVKDMQYEARNEEESERRKIIRLLKRAGAEQDQKKKEEQSKKEALDQSKKAEPSQPTPPTLSVSETKPDKVSATRDKTSGDGNASDLKEKPAESKAETTKNIPLQPSKKDFLSSSLRKEMMKSDIAAKKPMSLKMENFESKKRLHKMHKERIKEKMREVDLKLDDATSKPSAELPDTVSCAARDTKRGKITFRDKFSTCSFCDSTIHDRIRICSGCRKVCYCNSKCQKSHWKTHKKQCVYALSKDQKETTG